MTTARSKSRDDFPELSYSNASQPRLKRWIIRTVEGLSGRKRYAALYAIWRAEVQRGSRRCFARLLELIDVEVRHDEAWPPENLPETPLVMIANHPFGIGDGIAILSLAEKLDRPFRVMIAADLLKIPEMEPYALPVDFSETKEALKNNLAVRHEALRLLKEGVTVVIFPAGGVATAPKVLGKAQDLPWKIFVARLVQDAKASVIPIHFRGQNGRLFHLVSKYMNLVESEHKVVRFVGNLSLTLRLSLLVREFARLCGKSVEARVGAVLPWSELEPLRDRKALLERLQNAVLDLKPADPVKSPPRLRLVPTLRRREEPRKAA
ncbi:1-acyl-sn-glycerol-3-phosphate acyltransferase [Mesorhizobium sp. LHD-90]|uniref:1-acyl-sn-glycerol-3-phosphate acyltransferase n=1 Tax=Mesorhizobium sp. LHD-90 TaxID=3071414 RepID=UPI0027E0B03F|nr:1-acyl-sn-glycerol-3-phosphate acyltransferase [Mesorhizobium sp. LHD-90]MDQ6437189.1 1-acyl-sn-glycerol-3-phosphate acyltransferase [Mesorhizobium sp. LHD-90]